MNFDAYHLAELRTLCRDRRIMLHADFFRERHARRVRQFVCGNDYR